MAFLLFDDRFVVGRAPVLEAAVTEPQGLPATGPQVLLRLPEADVQVVVRVDGVETSIDIPAFVPPVNVAVAVNDAVHVTVGLGASSLLDGFGARLFSHGDFLFN